MWLKRLQLGLIHVAVTITLLPFNSILNRVMKNELAIAATVVAVLLSLPYALSPIQVAIGSFADRHPFRGRRRTPYIVIGLLLCIGGALVAPQAAFALAAGGWTGLLLTLLAFGAWGMGYNFATVSYFSLASELGDEKGRSLNIATMFTMMIISIIVVAAATSRMVNPYTPQALQQVFWLVSGLAAILSLFGLLGLEPPVSPGATLSAERHTWRQMAHAILGNRQATLFFIYLIVLLAAILGQDVLLEPFAGQAFGLTVEQTTRITSIWGTFFLLLLIVAGPLQRRIDKKTLCRLGAWGALLSFVLIVLSGVLRHAGLFYAGVILLGAATGLATVSNLSLMLDMTTPGNVGLFIGAWGASSAMARLFGSLISGAVYDLVTLAANGDLILGYLIIFSLEAAFLAVSLILLRYIDVRTFRQQAGDRSLSFTDQAALIGETGGG